MQNLSSGVIQQLMQGLGVQGPFYFQVMCKSPRQPLRPAGVEHAHDLGCCPVSFAQPNRTPPCSLSKSADMKPVATKSADPLAPKRYRLLVNDGANTGSMMLASQLQEMGDRALVADGSIIRVGEIIANELPGRK